MNSPTAKRLLAHYFGLFGKGIGMDWAYDNISETEQIVDEILEEPTRLFADLNETVIKSQNDRLERLEKGSAELRQRLDVLEGRSLDRPDRLGGEE